MTADFGFIAQIAPPGTCVAEAPIGDHETDLFPEEASYIATSVASRRREFATGRMLARQALAALGVPATALPRGPSGVPCWPDGFVGSITHTKSQAAALAARQTEFSGVGIDIEIVSRVPWAIMSKVTVVAEQRALAAAANPQLLLALIFSAKEAWFKCQFPLTRAYLGFEDAEIAVDWSRGTFDLRRTPGARGIDPPGQGRFIRGDDTVATLITMPSR